MRQLRPVGVGGQTEVLDDELDIDDAARPVSGRTRCRFLRRGESSMRWRIASTSSRSFCGSRCWVRISSRDGVEPPATAGSPATNAGAGQRLMFPRSTRVSARSRGKRRRCWRAGGRHRRSNADAGRSRTGCRPESGWTSRW